MWLHTHIQGGLSVTTIIPGYNLNPQKAIALFCILQIKPLSKYTEYFEEQVGLCVFWTSLYGGFVYPFSCIVYTMPIFSVRCIMKTLLKQWSNYTKLESINLNQLTLVSYLSSNDWLNNANVSLLVSISWTPMRTCHLMTKIYDSAVTRQSWCFRLQLTHRTFQTVQATPISTRPIRFPFLHWWMKWPHLQHVHCNCLHAC